MSIPAEILDEIAATLEAAQREARPVPQVTLRHAGLTLGDAYDIQDRIQAIKAARGEGLVGLKMGLTSRAKMKQVGVEVPIRGFLAESFAVPEGEAIDCSSLIHPRVEPELAFRTRAPLRGPGCHAGAVLAATDFIMGALEVIDSRYQDFKFDLPSVVADNCSSARFTVGGRALAPSEVDLRATGVVLEHNGRVVSTGASAAVLGNPAVSVATLANMLAERGQEIPAGTLVMTGGITAAVHVAPGDSVTARFQGFGSVSLCFV